MRPRIEEKELLQSFGRVFERLVEKSTNRFKSGDYEGTLATISKTAYFAWQFHSGVFSQQELEKTAIDIGKDLYQIEDEIPKPLFTVRSDPGRKNILHVASQLSDIGGHSRLIANWIHNDPQNNHSCIVTDQSVDEFPSEFRRTLRKNRGEMAILNIDHTLLRRAAVLRETSRQFDIVILHIHPNDVIPLTAYADATSPPVGLMNHADHVFWLGGSVADVVINLRRFGELLSKERRKVRASLILPIPINQNRSNIDRLQARKELGIKDGEVVIVSIGSEYKYLPGKTKDFFVTAKKILDLNSDAKLFVVGVRPENSRFQPHPRMTLLGPIPDATLYQAAADIYLEGFPVSSFTALLETVALGACPVLMYSPNRIGAFDIELGLVACETNARNEVEYVAMVSDLINDRDKRARIAAAVMYDVLEYHQGSLWKRYLNEIYDHLMAAPHNPELVRASQPCMKEEDLYLVELKNNELRNLNYPTWLDIRLRENLHGLFNFSDKWAMFRESTCIGDTRTLTDLIRWVLQ